MNLFAYRALLLGVAVTIFAAPVGAVTYKAAILERPNGAFSAKAYGATIGSQVGRAFFNGFGPRAIIWTDASGTFVDLHPLSGYETSFAYAVSADSRWVREELTARRAAIMRSCGTDRPTASSICTHLVFLNRPQGEFPGTTR
jgi:hypothetical protein